MSIKRILGIIAVLMVISGFGMVHSTKGVMEIVSLLLISCGVVIILILLLISKKNVDQ